jgi:hypothetical protein
MKQPHFVCCSYLLLLMVLLFSSGCATIVAPHPVSFLETARSLRSQGKNVRIKAGTNGVLPTFPQVDVRVALSERVEIGAGGYLAIGAGLQGYITGGKLSLKWQLLDNLAMFFSVGGSISNHENDIRIVGLGGDLGLLWSHSFGEVFSLFAGLRLGGMASLSAGADSLLGTALIAGVSFRITQAIELALEGGILPSLTFSESGSKATLALPYSAVSVNWSF